MSTTRAPRKSAAEQSADAKAAVERLHALVAENLTSETWLARLTFMSRLHGYSFRNRVLLWAQWEERRMVTEVLRALGLAFVGTPTIPSLPPATAFAAFSKWAELAEVDMQAEILRHGPVGETGGVQKGEKALSVLAPIIIKDKEDLDANGKPKEKLIGWKMVNRTFEISQTRGVTMPPEIATRLSGEGPAGAWRALAEMAEALGQEIRIVSLPGETNGRITYADNIIEIEGNNSPAQQVKTLAHEIAHKLLHEDAREMPRGEAETEAESVAYVVLQALDFDSSIYSVGYVASWSKGDGELLAATMTRVLQAADIITTFLETGELKSMSKPKAKADETAEAA